MISGLMAACITIQPGTRTERQSCFTARLSG